MKEISTILLLLFLFPILDNSINLTYNKINFQNDTSSSISEISTQNTFVYSEKLQELSLINQISRPNNLISMVIWNNFSLISHDYGYLIYNHSIHPFEQGIVKSFENFGKIYRIIPVDNYLFLQRSYDTLIINNTDYLNPILLGVCEDEIEDIYRYGEDFIYNDGAKSLKIASLNNGSLIEQNSITFPYWLRDLDVNNEIAAIGYMTGVYIVNITDSSNLEMIADIPIPGSYFMSTTNLKLHQDYLFVQSFERFFIFNVSHPDSPQILADQSHSTEAPMYSRYNEIAVHDDWVYFVGYTNPVMYLLRIQFNNISNPINPVFDTYPLSFNVHNIYATNNTLLLFKHSGYDECQIVTFNITNAPAMSLMFTEEISVMKNMDLCFGIDDLLVIPGGDLGLEIYNNSNPYSSDYLYSLPGYTHKAAIYREYVYYNNESTVLIYKINATTYEKQGQIVCSNFIDIAIWNSSLYILTTTTLSMYSLIDPSTPALIQEHSISSGDKIAIYQSYIILYGQINLFHIYNCSSLGTFSFLDTITMSFTASHILIENGMGYIGGIEKIQIWDFADMLTVHATSYPNITCVGINNGAAILDQNLYCSFYDGNTTINTYDISSLHNISILQTYGGSSTNTNVLFLKNSTIYLPMSTGGVHLIDTGYDSDYDSLTNNEEIYTYQTNPYNSDSDGDLMEDGWEVGYNLNPNINDSGNDLDMDDLSNLGEFYAKTNPYLNDTDADGMIDGWEVTQGSDPLNDDRNIDLDNDGLTNFEEYLHGTFIYVNDTDNDGMTDGWEVENLLDPLENDSEEDPDEDGLTNIGEYLHQINPNLNDTDADGMIDGWEVEYGLNPHSDDSEIDSDIDKLTNIEEYQFHTNPNLNDSDFDGMTDGWEIENECDPLQNDSNGDFDFDELTNIQEFIYKTNPNSNDTDSDGMPDKWELENSLRPTVSNGHDDFDFDELTNLKEYILKTNPNSNDTDNDGMQDGWEVNHELDPLIDDSKEDPDGDGFSNLEEFQKGTDPNISDKQPSTGDDAGNLHYNPSISGLQSLLLIGVCTISLIGLINWNRHMFSRRKNKK